MKYIRLFFVVLILSFGISNVSSKESDLIDTHRQWINERYSDTSGLSLQEKVLEATIIVSDGLREPEAISLLEDLSPQIPELKSYIKWLGSNKADPLLKNLLEALAGLKDYSYKKWPDSWIAARCHMAYLTAGGNIRDVDDEWLRLISAYETHVKSSTDLQELGILPMMKAISFCQRTCRKNYSYPDEYPEVFEIEKEALRVYPPGRHDNSLQNAEVYYWLGQLKTFLDNDFAAALLQSEADFNLGTDFIPIGLGGRYPCNSLWYFKEASRIAENQLNPGHPFVQAVKRSGLNFEANIKAYSPELWNRLEDNYSYYKDYYPVNTIERASEDCLRYIRCKQNGIESPKDISLKDNMDILEKSLGTKNPIFHQHLFQLASSLLFINPEDKYWFNRLVSTFEKSGIDPDSDVSLYYFSAFMNQMYLVDPEQAQTGIEAVYESYLENHSNSPLSILTGMALADYYLNNVSDNAKGESMLGIALADVSTPFTRELLNRADYWYIALRLALNPDAYNPDISDKYFNTLLEGLDISNPKGKNLLRYYLLSGQAALKASEGDYTEASRIAEEYDDLIASWLPDTRIMALEQQAYFLYALGEPREKTDPFIAKAIEIYNQYDNESLRPSTVQNIGAYYYNYGDFENALKWYSKAYELFRLREGEDAFTTDYMLLRQDLAATLEALGEYTEARNILAEDNDTLAETFGVGTGPDLLDALWLEYITLRKDNVSDGWTLMPKLKQISDLTIQLYNASGNDLRIRDKYLLRLSAEGLYISAINYTKVDVGNMSAQQKEMTESSLNMGKVLVPQLEEWLEEIRRTNPNYLRNSDYHEATIALSTYYAHIAEDIPHAIELVTPFMEEGTITGNNMMDYQNYLFLLNLAGRTEEAATFADRIEEAIPGLGGDFSDVKDALTSFRMQQYISSNQYDKALPYARDYFARHRAMLDGNFKLMTKLQQENYMQTHGDPADPLIGLLEYLPDQLAEEAYNAVLYRTGMQLRSHRATRDLIKKSGRTDLKVMLDSVESLRVEMANQGQWIATSDQEANNARIMKLGEIQKRTNRMEQRLLAELSELKEMTLADVTWTQVRDNLRNDEAAVEFVFSNNHILALILRPDYQAPRIIRLCVYDDLDAKLKSLGARNSASRAKLLYNPEDTSLYQLLWQPLEENLQSVNTIYCSLPGVLSTLAVNAFTTPDGDTLFDRYRILQLTTTGQLVFDHIDRIPETIAMMGDILYDDNQAPLSPDDPGSRAIDDEFDFSADFTDDNSRALKKCHFRHLPFTALEIESIGNQFDGENVNAERRREATEFRFRDMIQSRPEILHLATHGYYISPDADVTRYPFIMAKGGDNMHRSGIALAGAEKTWTGLSETPDENDGILTASEVAALDLSDTSLVALSACETALGDYSFEGIFGLQRGFKQAGVRSLLVSLWSVNDRSTSLFMTEFYQCLRAGGSRFEAWRKAVERVRKDYPDPYYWAPFILLDAV